MKLVFGSVDREVQLIGDNLELLEALRSMRSRYRFLSDSKHWGPLDEENIRAADNAIDKAEGRQV